MKLSKHVKFLSNESSKLEMIFSTVEDFFSSILGISTFAACCSDFFALADLVTGGGDNGNVIPFDVLTISCFVLPSNLILFSFPYSIVDPDLLIPREADLNSEGTIFLPKSSPSLDPVSESAYQKNNLR